jgi:hypothetical protein
VTQTTSVGRPCASSPVGGGERLGNDGAHGGECHGRLGRGAAERVGTGHDLAAAALAGSGIGGDGREGLVDRAGREPQVRGGAVRAAEPGERRQQRPLDVDRERGFVAHASGLLQSD